MTSDATHSQTCWQWHHECAALRIKAVRELVEMRLGRGKVVDDLIKKVLRALDGEA